MITIVKAPGIPDFSRLIHPNDVTYRTEQTATGRIIDSKLYSMPRFNQHLQLWKRVIMPDHVHFLLFVKERTPEKLGKYLACFKAECFSRFKEENPEHTSSSLFLPGFHDRVISGKRQVTTVKNYIDDNPRRLWLKRENPSLFSQSNRVIIDGMEFDARGNIFLLNDPDRHPVRISNKFTNQELIASKRLWLRTIENGGVLVSPFISEAEKKVRDHAMKNDGRMILIINNGFNPRFKPAGRWFDLCHAGRLLILAPPEYHTRKPDITRLWCLQANSHAESICANKFSLLPPNPQ